jgi:nucleoside-diphosphate-sugar epimerase
MATEIDAAKPVLVTGASGYVASWIIRYLLEDGRTVRGTVRDPDRAKGLEHLHALRQKINANGGKPRLREQARHRQPDIAQPHNSQSRRFCVKFLLQIRMCHTACASRSSTIRAAV